MSMSDPIADMLTRIRNAQMVGEDDVAMPASQAEVLDRQGPEGRGLHRGLRGAPNDGKPELEIALKYYAGSPVIERSSA
jgi:small subunit ribosomal protein S8